VLEQQYVRSYLQLCFQEIRIQRSPLLHLGLCWQWQRRIKSKEALAGSWLAGWLLSFWSRSLAYVR
jgi:hypothetical protein